MTGQHRLSGADSTQILGAVRAVVNEASTALRKIREWCDAQKPCAIGKGCVRCAVRAELVEEVRSLLPPLPEAAGEVEMEDDNFTRDDREYPAGGTDSN